MANANLPSFFADVKTSEAILALLGWDKIHAQYPNDKINCVARMEYNQKIYWAVNGTNPKEAKNIEALWNILENLPGNHEIVKLKNTSIAIKSIDVDPKVYILLFANNWKQVLYTDYNSKNPTPYNSRLFSCCERKLIKAVTDPRHDNFTIEVVMPPCELCLAAKEYLNNPNFQLNYANLWLVKAYDELHNLKLV